MKILLVPLAALLAIPSFAQAPSQPSPLPVRQVTLFTSGVSYTLRGGEVDGNAAVPLTFRTGQVNDILKSLVLLDATGTVQPATYAAKDPIGRVLRSFAVDVTSNQTQEELLNKLRGARVTVETAKKGSLTGQIVGVESRQLASDDGKVASAGFLNLLTDKGLASIRLDSEKTIRLLDERLNREFREALGLLASGSDDQRRQVTLHFAGTGKRQVRVGYVSEAPLWKMTYRLMLGGADAAVDAKPYLQGWALVENTSDEDWQNVKLSLVSGRPVSFIQDLYQPLYIPRPVVGPDIIASPFPQTHAGNMLEEDKRVAGENAPAGPGGARKEGAAAAMGRIQQRGGGGGGFGGGGRGGLGDLVPEGVADKMAYDMDNTILFRQSVEAQAAGASAGELFQYNISSPVNLPRQQAAMIPVVAQDIETEKLSLLNLAPNTGMTARFPLNAVRIKNTTKLHLKGGPLTLFDEGVYAGDARMGDIPPGDSRLVTYAVDIAIEGSSVGPGASQTETSISLRRGVLTMLRKERQETTYNLKSKSDKPRTVLIEHPLNAEFKLIAPDKPEEQTAALYRFSVVIPPGKAQSLKVVVERPLSEQISILDHDLNTLTYYSNRGDISPKMRETLQQVVQRRRKVQELTAQAKVKEGEIGTMMQDQDRIVKNMAALDKNSALYKRYITTLDQQETTIQTLRTEAAKLRKDASDADIELRAFLDGIELTESVK